MVKDAIERAVAYERKLDADVVRARISARKEEMARKASVRQAELAEYQSKLKAILDEVGVPPELNVVFFKIVNKLYGEKRKHASTTFANVAQAVLDANYLKLRNWINNNSFITILQAIASIFNIQWNPPS